MHIDRALLGGYDWGGRAACVVAALWPERVRGLVSVGGYNVQDIARAGAPAPPEAEYRLWYQYYLHGERGRAGLAQDRAGFCKLLWRLWSPTWAFSDATYERSAASFDNADFVDVVVHSYRHRFGLAAGDPALAGLQVRLAARPPITVPTLTLAGDADGVWGPDTSPPQPGRFTGRFTGRQAHRVVAGVGHDLPQEAPQAFADAMLEVDGWR